jgi:hypothetical protein
VIEVYDIAGSGQGTLAFTLSLNDLRSGQMGTGLGNELALLDSGDAQISAVDLMGMYTFFFDPAICGAP